MANELIAAVAGAALAASAQSPPETPQPRLSGSFPVVELRQYTLHKGQRDTLVNLFEREFIESQEALGMKVIGTFTDLDRPDRFVWLRGFRNMDSRAAGLSAFYTGPVWQEHRDAANATMIDSDNVLLLHAPRPAAEFAPAPPRPALGQHAPSGLIVATIYYLKRPPAEALAMFENELKPRLDRAGIAPLAWLRIEAAPNNFPRLPVREGEEVVAWFARFDSAADYDARKAAVDEAASPILPLLDRPPEVLRLRPTARSELR